MSASNFKELRQHIGHKLACVMYGDGVNVAVECETCNEVLMDFDNDEGDDTKELYKGYILVTTGTQANVCDELEPYEDEGTTTLIRKFDKSKGY